MNDYTNILKVADVYTLCGVAGRKLVKDLAAALRAEIARNAELEKTLTAVKVWDRTVAYPCRHSVPGECGWRSAEQSQAAGRGSSDK
jgi:hypothetical protein